MHTHTTQDDIYIIFHYSLIGSWVHDQERTGEPIKRIVFLASIRDHNSQLPPIV
jgi:hypothetical protein